jgi:hypothetical protein
VSDARTAFARARSCVHGAGNRSPERLPFGSCGERAKRLESMTSLTRSPVMLHSSPPGNDVRDPLILECGACGGVKVLDRADQAAILAELTMPAARRILECPCGRFQRVLGARIIRQEAAR